MKEYLVVAVVMALASALLAELSHPALSSGSNIALGIVAVLFIVAPIAGIAAEGITLPAPEVALPAYGGIEEVAEEAYLVGVRAELAERFSVNAEEIDLEISDFSLEELSCERLVVTLRGGAAFADYRAIRQYLLENLKIGECDVKIEG